MRSRPLLVLQPALAQPLQAAPANGRKASMKLGQRMLRLEDGQRGTVAQNGPELRVVYLDRGEERIASKKEKWVPDELPPMPLRAEEKLLVAQHADRALRAIDRHEPHKTWEAIHPGEPFHDLGLVNVILRYLADRQKPTA